MKELKLRIFSSLPLILIVYLSLENLLLLLITLFLITLILLSEFNKIYSKIFKKLKLLRLILTFFTTL